MISSRWFGLLAVIVLGLCVLSGRRRIHSLPAPVDARSPASLSSERLEPKPSPSQEVAPLVSEPSFSTLPELTLFNVNTKETGRVRLYDGRGNIDARAATVFDTLLADSRRKDQILTYPIDRRLLQILVRSAYHFHKTHIEVVSGYRQPLNRREGYHALGRAVDYRLEGIEAAALASYLRRIPKLGVGIYTHPKTQYVHLDVREESYHWLDASPPKRYWRVRGLREGNLVELDRRYNSADDWPEGYSRF